MTRITRWRCDRCGTEHDTAWYHLSTHVAGGDCRQSERDLDLCGLCHSQLATFLDATASPDTPETRE